MKKTRNLHENYVDLNKKFGDERQAIGERIAKRWLVKIGEKLKVEVRKKEWEIFQQKLKKTGGLYRVKYDELRNLGTVNRARLAQIAHDHVTDVSKEAYTQLKINRETFSDVQEGIYAIQDSQNQLADQEKEIDKAARNIRLESEKKPKTKGGFAFKEFKISDMYKMNEYMCFACDNGMACP